jgi:3-hydroxyacyl-CoA dehydrogenase
LNNVTCHSSIEESVASSFLVQETIHEDLEAKRELFRERAVEVLDASFTDARIVARAQAFSSIDHVSITSRESPGFIINRIQYALKAEVMKILEQGVASVADVDALSVGLHLQRDRQ